VRDPSLLRDPTPQERALAAMYLDVQRRCAIQLESAGETADAATHRDLVRTLRSALQ